MNAWDVAVVALGFIGLGLVSEGLTRSWKLGRRVTKAWRVRRSDAEYLRDLEQREWRRGW